jgi:DUF1365 family protein
VFFCYDQENSLLAILYEVCNTFKERHTYVIPVDRTSGSVIRQNCSKKLYVSPFIPIDGEYHFRIVPPGEYINVVIQHKNSAASLLTASFKGERKPFTALVLIGNLLRFPMMTLKIVAGIHFEAMRLWLKGLKTFVHQPASRTVDSSVVPANTTQH